jgi:hypothetical protein
MLTGRKKSLCATAVDIDVCSTQRRDPNNRTVLNGGALPAGEAPQ